MDFDNMGDYDRQRMTRPIYEMDLDDDIVSQLTKERADRYAEYKAPRESTIGEALGSLIAASLPALVGGLIGGEEGLGYGLKAGAGSALAYNEGADRRHKEYKDSLMGDIIELDRKLAGDQMATAAERKSQREAAQKIQELKLKAQLDPSDNQAMMDAYMVAAGNNPALARQMMGADLIAKGRRSGGTTINNIYDPNREALPEWAQKQMVGDSKALSSLNDTLAAIDKLGDSANKSYLDEKGQFSPSNAVSLIGDSLLTGVFGAETPKGKTEAAFNRFLTDYIFEKTGKAATEKELALLRSNLSGGGALPPSWGTVRDNLKSVREEILRGGLGRVQTVKEFGRKGDPEPKVEEVGRKIEQNSGRGFEAPAPPGQQYSREELEAAKRAIAAKRQGK